MLEGKALAAALEEIGPSAFHGIIFRCVSLSSLLGLKNEAGHLVITRPNPDFLYAGGPVRDGGRFTPKGGAESLYTGETEHPRQGWRNARQRGSMPSRESHAVLKWLIH
jgi:hypothetical protein